jgi:hypothetical protein
MRDGVVTVREALVENVIGLPKVGDPYIEQVARLENYYEYKGNKLEMEAEEAGLKFNKCPVCVGEYGLKKRAKREHFHRFLEIVAMEARAYCMPPKEFFWSEED